jgi:septal ring factor EnvC (AmiA/AmiB activator)
MRLFAFITLLLFSAEPLLANNKYEDLKAIKSKIRDTEQKILSQQGQQSKVQQQLKQSEVSLGKAQAEIHKLKKSIDTEQRQLNQLQKQQEQLNKDKITQEKKIAEQINASYRLGREKKVKILLNPEDPEKLSRAIIYSDYFNKARIESINEYQNTVAEIEKIKPAISANQKALLKNKDALVAKQKSIEKDIKKRNQILSKINSNIKNDESALKQLQADQKQLEELLKAVEITVQNIKLPDDSIPFRKMQGKLPWPTSGRLDKRFGRKRPHTDLRYEGVAFYSNKGNNVTASHHGRVVFADWFRGKGLLLIIDHGEGYMTLYAHNQSLLREAGDWVSAGESIATVGDSGGLDHSELYFEIRKNGEPLNPRKWLAKK